jgi:hypothetical protein
MELALPFGSRKITFDAPWPPEQLAIARRPPLPEPCDWTDAAGRALSSPIGARSLAETPLEGKSAVIIIDADPGRMPIADILPIVIDCLEQAGVRKTDISIIAGGGDGPASGTGIERLIGADLAGEHTATQHDPFSADHQFCGFSALGTPIFVSNIALEADFRVAVGCVRPHASLGYTGGDDAILPGVCAFETITRHAALGFAGTSSCGHLEDNPSRLDVENVGATVGLDHILNFVVTLDGEPVAAFAGHPVKAHRAAVNLGDKGVWGGELGGPADIAIASPGIDRPGDAPFDPAVIDFVACGVKLGGSIVLLASPGMLPKPEGKEEAALAELTVGELARRHEKRDWRGKPIEIAARLRAIRNAYFARKPVFVRSIILAGSDLPVGALEHLGVEQTETLQEAVDIVADRHGPDAQVALVPDASTTLCLPELH